LTQAEMKTTSDLFQVPQEPRVNLITDERYNPLKSRTKEAHLR
jgi:hypothetical protein